MTELDDKLKKMQEENDANQFDDKRCVFCLGYDNSCEAYAPLEKSYKCTWAQVLDEQIEKTKRDFGIS